MGRSRVAGKPVEDLTADEVRREIARCLAFLRRAGDLVAAKGIRKRLVQLRKRER